MEDSYKAFTCHSAAAAHLGGMLKRLLTLLAATALVSPASGQDLLDRRVTPDSMAQVQLSYSPVVRQTAPAVVNVFTSRTVQRRRSLMEEFFGGSMPRERQEGSLGSGVIVRGSGVIVTNSHVVRGADELRVVLNDRREFPAELVAEDETLDLAVLQIDTKGEVLPNLRIEAGGDIEIGDIVLAIGNPFGVGQTVTSGIVSALGRTNVADASSYIQTDAAVNPGNSGGALVNLDGELVGVNTAIFSRSGGSNGIGFAIPGELVARAVDSAITEGRIVRPWIGARTQGLDSTMAAALGLDRARGTVISELYRRGPADRAGLRKGDVILAVDGSDVNDDSGLLFKLATLRQGSRARVLYLRDGAERTATVVVELPGEVPPRDERDLDGMNPLDGATVVNLSPAYAEEVGLDPYVTGVMVSGIVRRSAASANGLRPGDIVVELDGVEIVSAKQLQDRLRRRQGEADWRLSIDRRGRIYDVPIRALPRG